MEKVNLSIKIRYHGIWCNSFLSGTNDKPISKTNVRSPIISSQHLKKGLVHTPPTHNTAIGIVNRLIGDPRKLFQIREDSSYILKDLEDKVEIYQEFISTPELISLKNSDSNITSQTQFNGLVKDDPNFFNSEEAKIIWQTLWLSQEELTTWLRSDRSEYPDPEFPFAANFDGVILANRLEEISQLKPIPLNQEIFEIFEQLHHHFSVDYLKPETIQAFEKGDSKKSKFYIASLYFSALYLVIELLEKNKKPIDRFLSKRGSLVGISKRTFTKRDFMIPHTKGKKVLRNFPYISKTFEKGLGEIVDMLDKRDGLLVINFKEISKNKADEIESRIEAAKVSNFKVGKKGIAWIETIHQSNQ